MTYGDLYNAIPLWVGFAAGAVGVLILGVLLIGRRFGKW